MNNKQIILHLSLIDGVGPITIKKLIENKPDEIPFSDFYHLSASDFVRHCALSNVSAQKLVTGLADKSVLEKELALIEKHGVHYAVLGQKEYPDLLANIYAPPPVLYWCGYPVFKEQKAIAFVGSRTAHRYAEEVIQRLVPAMVHEGWVIVSGGALGADAMAHRETIKFHGKTVVVLGSGLLKPYPASHHTLFEDILDNGGALVSSFPLTTQARPGNFPARNRIIAGLSRGCVVVQAAEKSGACITAQYALEQAREVFAVPGLIGDELSVGCHRLIQAGAKLVQCADDIFVEFDLSHELRPQVQMPVIKIAKKISPGPEKSVKTHHVDTAPEAQLVKACVSPMSADDLAVALGIEIHEVQELLFDLQIAGRVQQNFAGLWERA